MPKLLPLLLVALSLTSQTDAWADNDSPKPLRGFVDLNGYYDSRGFSVMTVNLLANIPGRLQYFSLSNYANTIDPTELLDLEGYFTEQNLSWSPVERVPLSLSAQWVHRSGESNDMLRLGIRWRLMNTQGIQDWFKKINLMYFINFHAYQFDFIDANGYPIQIEHVYRLTILPNLFDRRVYLGGFLDHNLLLGGDDGTDVNTIVTEHQLGVRLFDQLHLVVEFRRNEFFAEKKNGVGFGIEYVILFERIH